VSENRIARLLSGFTASYLNTAVSTVCSLIAVRLYVHYLGKEEYGLWLVVLSLLGPLAMTGVGFPTVTQNTLAEAKAQGDWDQVNRVLTTGLVLLTLSTVLSKGGTTL
jgi:O-antigen/teichoic acid export membrane protein